MSYPCDLAGNKLTPDGAGKLPRIAIYRDSYTAKTFAKVAECLPSGTDSTSLQALAAIQKLDPIHYTSSDGAVVGWFVEAPDFNGREGN